MSDILCVTDRTLCREDFLDQVRRIAAARPAGLLLREKDLSEEAYRRLAAQVLPLCQAQAVPCLLHSFPQAALDLRADGLHLPLPLLRALPEQQRAQFARLGTSCHSPAEAREAQDLGCTYLIAGHIFATNCKPGLPGRGPDFLAQVCQAVTVPVYAIGGIAPENIHRVRRAGARGACLRSAFMTCPDPAAMLTDLERREPCPSQKNSSCCMP